MRRAFRAGGREVWTRDGGVAALLDSVHELSSDRTVSVRIVRLGSPRLAGEGTRIGTVRRPPRGVRREAWASGDWFDVWYPELAPSATLLRAAPAAATPSQWRRFAVRYRREMATPSSRRTLELLAALSRTADFSIGCYCADEARCHRSVLRELLREAGARLG